MSTSSTSETTFRAVFRFTDIEGGSYCVFRQTEDEAWADADDMVAKHPASWVDGEWFVQQTITTTTTQDLAR